MSVKRLKDRLPDSIAEVAHDSFWTLTVEASLIITVTASFLMLGRELGPEGYGEYVGLFALLTPISAVGSAAALATLQACIQERRPVDQVLSTFLMIVIAGGTAATVIAALVAPLILKSLSMTAIITVAISELILAPAVRVIAGGVRAVRGVPPAVRIDLSVLVLRFVALVSLFAFGMLTVERLGVGWVVATLDVLVWLLFIKLPALDIKLRFGKASLRDVRMVGALGAPIYVSDFQTNGDKLVLNGAGLQQEAGLYGAAFRVASLALTPLRAMDVAVFHRFLESDDNQVGMHIRRARLYTMWSMAVLAPIAAVLFIAAPLLKIVVGEDFGGSVTMMRWLVLWLPFRVVSAPPLSGLLGLGRLGMRLVVLIASATISMVLYLILIPKLGWEGAVIGTVVSEICLAVFGWSALVWAQRMRDGELDENRPVHAMDGPPKWVSARRRHS